jgi:hypothetical protein
VCACRAEQWPLKAAKSVMVLRGSASPPARAVHILGSGPKIHHPVCTQRSALAPPAARGGAAPATTSTAQHKASTKKALDALLQGLHIHHNNMCPLVPDDTILWLPCRRCNRHTVHQLHQPRLAPMFEQYFCTHIAALARSLQNQEISAAARAVGPAHRRDQRTREAPRLTKFTHEDHEAPDTEAPTCQHAADIRVGLRQPAHVHGCEKARDGH